MIVRLFGEDTEKNVFFCVDSKSSMDDRSLVSSPVILVLFLLVCCMVALLVDRRTRLRVEYAKAVKSAPPIPRLIHQTWKTHDVPERFAAGVESWKSMNPGFRYKLYDDAECRALVSSAYPEFLSFYDRLSSGVQRADVFRYLVIHQFGGVYADLDTHCLRPIAEALEDASVVTGEETNQYQFQLLQWFFAARPKMDVLLDVVREIQRRVERDNRSKMLQDPRYAASGQKEMAKTLYETGPWVFTDVLKASIEDGTVKVFPPCSFGCSTEPAEGTVLYVRHDYAGTWKK